MKHIKDEEFIRGNIPMTKFEVRVLTLALLEIEEEDAFLDIGGGTGSISIECALNGARVHTIEREEEGIELIGKNAHKFNVKINAVKGSAPDDLPEDIRFNKCFIGGSGGNLSSILKYIDSHLAHGGIVCANFITIKNLNEFIELLESHGYKNIETRLVQVSNMDRLGLLKANNPVFIIRGTKP
ncbi:precorrin-6Y C5,15-methyltransferase (decarboxylating) subunit CbiT [Oxobacter pfennigii]|nr:precorrin-6Y C5,15-methyltransferase (decarboxylating) subunit CbiT [Oxobacter pfennigii]